MVNHSIKIRRRKYFLYETFKTKKEAIRIAKYYNKKNKQNKTYILHTEKGYLFPTEVYALYMTKIRKIW